MNKTYIKLYASVFVLFVIGCDSDSVGPESGTTSGRSTLTTELVNNQGVGFSFVKGDTVVVSTSAIVKPDIFVLIQRNDDGEILGVFLGGRTFLPTFSLKYASMNSDSAKMYFQNLKEFSDSTYSELAIPATQNQVWVVKTTDDEYAKILIISTSAYDDNSNPSAPTSYGEVTFDWVYQPSGERKF